MPMTQREMIKFLKKHGFVEVKGQGKGSHVKMRKAGLPRTITVPHGEIRFGTEQGILKEAGLK